MSEQHGKSMRLEQQMLPFDKQRFADRCAAIEKLSCKATGLSDGQLRKVRGFLKMVFKHKWSSPDGTITFVRCATKLAGAKNLAFEFEVTGRTIDNWLRWSADAGLIHTSVSADKYGRRQTTLEFRWENIEALAGGHFEADFERDFEGTKAKRFPDQSETVSGPKRNGFRTKAKRFPNQSETVSLSYNQVLPILPTSTSEAVGSEEVVLESSFSIRQRLIAAKVYEEVADRLVGKFDSGEIDRVLVEFEHAARVGKVDGAGAIVIRLETGRWPTVGVETFEQIQAAKMRRAAAEARHAAELATERRREQAKRAEEDRLEQAYGSLWDAMDSEAQLAAVLEVCPGPLTARVFRSFPDSCRMDGLKWLEGRERCFERRGDTTHAFCERRGDTTPTFGERRGDTTPTLEVAWQQQHN